MTAPAFITFDIFGTVVDWRGGLERDCAAAGRPLTSGDFERIIDAQAAIESGGWLSYTEVTRRSLIEVIGLEDRAALEIATRVGRWPLYADSKEALRSLMRVAPCAALTNSDHVHSAQVQEQLGFRLSDWLCAEESRVYKPDPRMWHAMAARRRIESGPSWWHVSAYADYDLAVANQLGLTTVFVKRPHSRHGAATHAVVGLAGLAGLLAPVER